LTKHWLDVQELLEKEGSGLKVLLLNNMHSDISRMFRLFSRIAGRHTTQTDIQSYKIIECIWDTTHV
jgi:hypothetical protein